MHPCLRRYEPKDTSVGEIRSKQCLAAALRAVLALWVLAVPLGAAAGGRESTPVCHEAEWQVPVALPDRQSWVGVQSTAIGGFGTTRIARPGAPAHLHTGMDIRRPTDNYRNEPIFPAAAGVVVSMRDDGAFAQVIIRHDTGDGPVWTVYEHVAGITVAPGDSVSPCRPVARFMTREELDARGWQFDHVHFEVMITPPPAVAADPGLPHRHFGTWALVCHTRVELASRYVDPVEFMAQRWRNGAASRQREPDR